MQNTRSASFWQGRNGDKRRHFGFRFALPCRVGVVRGKIALPGESLSSARVVTVHNQKLSTPAHKHCYSRSTPSSSCIYYLPITHPPTSTVRPLFPQEAPTSFLASTIQMPRAASVSTPTLRRNQVSTRALCVTISPLTNLLQRQA